MIKLETPIRINKTMVKNRIVMPPLVCFNWADEKGFETVSRAEHYGKRSDAETGLIVIEAAAIEPTGRIVESELGIWDDEHIPQYTRIAKRCHQSDAVAIVQIVHAGSKSIGQTVISSSVHEVEEKTVLEMTLDQIEDVKSSFVKAAVRAYKAGLDGVEVHGAHGYLLSQFTAETVNKRTDHYGGSVENRVKLSLEIVKLIREATSKEFIIGYRYGVNDPSFEDDVLMVKLLDEAGVDMFNVSAGIGIKSFEVPNNYPASFITYLGYQMKQHTEKPVVSVFGILDPELAIELIEKDYTDMVAVGRGLLADPKWSEKALSREKINRCYHCKPRCKFAVDGHQCPWANK